MKKNAKFHIMFLLIITILFLVICACDQEPVITITNVQKVEVITYTAMVFILFLSQFMAARILARTLLE